MNNAGFLQITASEQGLIDGSCDIAELENQIEIYDFEHIVDLKRDPYTNLASSERFHQPLQITKSVDKSTPKIYQALCTSELLTEVEISWYNYTAGNELTLFYQILLEDANISSVIAETKAQEQPVNVEQVIQPVSMQERVSFIYQRIRWVWGTDGIEFEDTWDRQTEEE